MNFRKGLPLIIAALALGLVLGNVASGFAAAGSTSTGATNTVAAACGNAGLRLGTAMRDAGGRMADVVAKLTGQDVEAVIEQRKAGDSFADIAQSKGVAAEKVVDEALTVRKQVLDQRVADGSITQQQADDALAGMQSRLTERVQSTQPGCGNGMGGGRGGMGRGGAGGCGGGGCGAGGAGGCQAPVTQ